MGNEPRYWPAAVVFDCDGVLTETGEIKNEAFRELFASHPEHLEAIGRYHEEHLGISRYEKFDWIYEHILRRPLGSEERNDLGRRFSRLVVDASARCPAVRGAEEAIERLASAGVPLFVASGIPQPELVSLMAARGWSRWFTEIHGSPRRKPEILTSVASRLGVEANRLVFVGDGWSDYEAARRVGARFVLRETSSQAERFHSYPGARVADLEPLLDLLMDQNSVAVAS